MSCQRLFRLCFAAATTFLWAQIQPFDAIYGADPEEENPAAVLEEPADGDIAEDDAKDAGAEVGAGNAGPPLSEEELSHLKEQFNQLASPNFQARENATSRLVQFGPRAVASLKEWQAEAKSPEVFARSQLVIDYIERNGMAARIDLFLRNPGNVEEHKFYGWKSFSQIVGTNRLARQLFISLLARHEQFCNEDIPADSLAALEKKFVKQIEDDRHEFIDNTVADAIVAQYLMIRLGDKSSAELEKVSNRIVPMAPYTTELSNTQTKTLKRLTGAWVKTVQRDPHYALLLCLSFPIPEGVELARKTLRSGTVGESSYSLSMQALMLYGSRDDLSLVESFFGNTEICYKENQIENGQIHMIVQQYQDMALAVAVRIRGYKLADYFASVQEHNLRGINPSSIFFIGPDAEALRKSAFDRYHTAVAAEKNSTN